MKIGIEEIATYLPKNKISNYERLHEFDINHDFVDKKTGFKYLFKINKKDQASDLCMGAFFNLEKRKKINLDDIGCCVVVTQNPDYKIPNVSSILHKKLKLNQNCSCFDISLGCSGYVYSLSIITSFMKSNKISKGLLFTADPYSKIIDENDKNTSLLFGDGASVTLISQNKKYVTGKFSFGTKGENYKDLIYNNKLSMNGRSVFNFSAKNIPNDIIKVLKLNNLKKEEIDLFVLHQGSKLIIDTIRDKLNIEENKLKFYASEYGNLISSSIPFGLESEILNYKNKNILISGFGVGFSWSSTLLKKI